MIDTILNAKGESLDFTLTEGTKAPLVVIGHGVTANKDRPWALTLARVLREAGYGSLGFSFSGNGSSEGEFGQSTVTKEVADLRAVLDAVSKAGVDEVCYVGHSMGAAVGVIAACLDRRITRLVSLAGMVHTAAFVERKFGHLTPDVDVMWDREDCPLSSTFVADLRGIDSVRERGANVRMPWLLVHGLEDTVVPVDESREISSRAPQAELLELPGVDHVFTGEGAGQMADAVAAWLGRH